MEMITHKVDTLARKIGNRVAAAILLLVVVFSSVSAYLFNRGVSLEFQARIASLGENVSGTLAGPLSVALAFGGLSGDILGTLKQPLTGVVDRKDIMYAALIKDGKPVVWDGRRGVPVEEALQESHETGAIFAGKYPVRRTAGRRHFEIRLPVVRDGKTLAEIALGFSDADVRRTVRLAIVNMLILGVVMTVLINVLLKKFLQRTVSEPLKGVVHVAAAIAQGDLTVQPPASSDVDELNRLTASFVAMIGNLRTLSGELQNIAEDIHRSSQGMSLSTQETARNSGQLSDTLAQIASSGSKVVQSSQQASQAAQAANEAATKGRAGLERVRGLMASIQSTVSAAVKSINDLAVSSAKIDEIVSIISKIADQTNLLSLNAAIEAARAGETGRGFAVVAEEVRKLAESSSASAQEISQITQTVLSKTSETSAIVEKGGKEVSGGGAEVQDVTHQFEGIFEGIETVARQMGQMTSIAEETAHSTDSASAAATEMAAATEEVTANAQMLTDTAQRLKVAAGRFKLS